jgi:hypothetical protein
LQFVFNELENKIFVVFQQLLFGTKQIVKAEDLKFKFSELATIPIISGTKACNEAIVSEAEGIKKARSYLASGF